VRRSSRFDIAGLQDVPGYTGETAFRLVWLVLASWRSRLITQDRIILVVMLFVIFGKVWMKVSDVYDPHIWWDVSELK